MKAGFYVVTLMVTQIRGKIRELLSLLRLGTVYVRRSNPPCLIPLDPWQFVMDFFVVFFVVLLESLFPFSEFGKLYGKICLVSHENR